MFKLFWALFVLLFEASSNVVTLDDCCSVPQFNLCCLKLEYSSLLISCSLELTFNVQSMIIYRMVIVEGRCDQLTSSSLHTYIIIGWHKSKVTSDWLHTLVWFGQILLLLYFYHPIYMILVFSKKQNSQMMSSALILQMGNTSYDITLKLHPLSFFSNFHHSSRDPKTKIQLTQAIHWEISFELWITFLKRIM